MSNAERELDAVMAIIDGVRAYADPEPEVRAIRVIAHLLNVALLERKRAEKAAALGRWMGGDSDPYCPDCGGSIPEHQHHGHHGPEWRCS